MYASLINTNNSFFDLNIASIIEIGLLIVAWLSLRRESRKDTSDREESKEEALRKQLELHSENTKKLDRLAEFNEIQAKINEKRDTQIDLLKTQTTQLTIMAEGFERRVTMLENSRQRHFEGKG